LHAGHIQFFSDAKALGDQLVVSVATDAVLELCKGRRPSIPLDNRLAVVRALRTVDCALSSSNFDAVFDFRDSILGQHADILAVTDDDRHKEVKQHFCRSNGIQYISLPKRNCLTRTSTTEIRTGIRRGPAVPLRVDFAGGWLDVPRFSRSGAYIVNCAIQPLVTLSDWPYEIASGLGGSAARAILEDRNACHTELDAGVGWQDPAVILETGLCVWRSGPGPILDTKLNPDWLCGRMSIYWTGRSHNTLKLADLPRDYRAIEGAGYVAKRAVDERDVNLLAKAIEATYQVQRDEGMESLPTFGEIARKYLGSGHGGYALYLFASPEGRSDVKVQGMKQIEPYLSAV